MAARLARVSNGAVVLPASLTPDEVAVERRVEAALERWRGSRDPVGMVLEGLFPAAAMAAWRKAAPADYLAWRAAGGPEVRRIDALAG